MPVNWKAEDAYTRLLAAIVAANDLKVRIPYLLEFSHFCISSLSLLYSVQNSMKSTALSTTLYDLAYREYHVPDSFIIASPFAP